ncbi:sigma-70 family RNA polymerase sigma factor [Eubacteriales bacterium OttesenSCG-928-G02]|nr:sigma-70 family RNA polymerase sigma factor [Eubacteriales bacterium OttesenSCG-928-G02]
MINENDLVKYIKPIYSFCMKRLNNLHDAEDLTNEILLHILEGVKKYEITSLNAWVWRIAHNRYARFIDVKNKNIIDLTDIAFVDMADTCNFVDNIIIKQEYQQVFRYFNTLSSEYRKIMVDYYIDQLPVKAIAEKHKLSIPAVKKRLNISREKIKKRIGENKMDKIYKRINWNTTTCNGSMDSDKYLNSQIARAICESAYEEPLTIEEISLKTGLPAMYIEEEIPRLMYGDAIVKINKKYAANFIVLRLSDKQRMIKNFEPLVKKIADFFENSFKNGEKLVSKMDFYGSDFKMNRLGYILTPAILRCEISRNIDNLNLDEGPFPPRQDGGYGWFMVDETETPEEKLDNTAIGNNSWGDKKASLYYLWIGKYFDNNVYRNGIIKIWDHKLIEKAENGKIAKEIFSESELISLLKTNLIVKENDNYVLNFPVFEKSEYLEFVKIFNCFGKDFDTALSSLITEVCENFKAFVPKRLKNQINVWVKYYSYNLIGFVIEELIERGVLEKPNGNKPLINGVLCVNNIDNLKI